MKSALPWVLVAALLVAGYCLYSANQSRDARIAQLTEENSALPALRAENESLKKQSVQADELDRLRKDNADLLRLRNEVRQLRDRGAELTNQLAAAQSRLGQAQVQQQEANRLAQENQNLRVQTQQIQQARQAAVQSQAAGCINNLRVLEAAKQQWAMQNFKPPGSLPTMADITPFLPNNAVPACPGGGVYTLNAIGRMPTCNLPGHILP